MPGIKGMRWRDLRPGTPGRLLVWIAVPVLGVLACGLLLAACVGGLRDGLGLVGSREEPEVVAASRLSFDLQSMDGHVADLLLIGDATGLAENRADAYQKFESDQSDADSQLELLGSGIDTIPDGPATYVSIENQLSQYTQYVSYAMYIDDQTHGQPAGQPPAAALQAYDHGSTLMNQDVSGILAQAEFLYTAEQLAESAPVGSGDATILHLQIACGLLIALIVIRLLLTQRHLSRAFRRTVNPLLGLATVVALIFGVLLFSALGAAKSAYGAQDLTGPDSVSTLWQARATAAGMHAAESRWVLDGRDPAQQQDFGTGQKWITAVPQFPVSVTAALNSYIESEQTLQTLVQGAGTREAYTRALVAYETGPATAAYARFDAALSTVIAADLKRFSLATARGQDGLVTWLWLPWLWMAAVVALVLLAFAPRLREYR
ncbi:MAG TPA: hypothetical protein VFN97_15415 [Actinospica sp.]|nr:hypothetical protein [Actinospica sp.]